MRVLEKPFYTPSTDIILPALCTKGSNSKGFSDLLIQKTGLSSGGEVPTQGEPPLSFKVTPVHAETPMSSPTDIEEHICPRILQLTSSFKRPSRVLYFLITAWEIKNRLSISHDQEINTLGTASWAWSEPK